MLTANVGRMANPQLSVVSPCYNEEQCLFELYRRLTAVCKAAVGDNYEIVLVDDGSRDATRGLITQFAADDHHVVGVLLSRNFGHQMALSAGLEVCRGDRVLIIDADLQDPPELLTEMMSQMDKGFDVVYGQRIQRHGDGLFKRFSAAAFYRLLNSLVDIDIPPSSADFRLVSRRALNVLLSMPERDRFIRGMIRWVGFPQTPVLYDRQGRFAGSTKYPLRKMLRLAIDAITSFSIVPLRIASFLGISFAFVGLLVLVQVVVEWWYGSTIPGWASLMSAVVLLGSVQLIVIGILGEYLGRLYIESKQRPPYVIEKVIRSSKIPVGAQTGQE